MKRMLSAISPWMRQNSLIISLVAFLNVCPQSEANTPAHSNGITVGGGGAVSQCASCTVTRWFQHTLHRGVDTPGWEYAAAESLGCKVDINGDQITFSAGEKKLKTGSFTVTVTVSWECLEETPCPPGSARASLTVDVVGDDDGSQDAAGASAGCGGSCGEMPALGTASFGQDGADFRLALGAANRDANQQYKTAGYLLLKTNTFSASLATPSALSLPYRRTGVERIPTNETATLQQVKTPEGLVQVTNVNNGYSLSVYDKTQVGDIAGGVYPLLSNATPFVTWTIITNGNQTSLQVTENRSGRENVYLYTYTTNGSTETWNLSRPDTSYTISQKTTTTGGYTTSFELHNPDGTLVQKNVKTYVHIASLEDFLLTQVVEGDGSITRTTTYTYYPEDDSTSPNRLRRVVYPDGDWVYYQYDGAGRKQFEYATFNNTPSPADDESPVLAQCKKTEYDYNNDPFSAKYLPACTIVYLPSGSGAQHEVSRTTVSRTYTEDLQLHWMTVTGPENLVTTTEYITNQGPNLGLVASVTHPDGTKSYFGYAAIGTNGVATTTNNVGEPYTNGCILNGRQVETQTDRVGRVLSRITRSIQDGQASIVLAQQTNQYSSTSRDYSVTDVLANRITSYTYDCCGLSAMMDPEGIITLYTNDSLHRQVSSKVLRGGIVGVTTTNVFDAAGQVLATRRIGIGDTASQAVSIQQYQYDVLGRVIRGTNALGGVITNLYGVNIDGRRQEVTLYQDGGTRTNDYFLDGRLQRVTGTAVAPVAYEYGIEDEAQNGVWREYVKETKLNTNWVATSEWTKTYTDGAGRSYKTVYAAETGNPSRQSWYNSNGQLWKQIDPDGVVTLYQYNGKGELAYTATDVNQNDEIDFDGQDRITCKLSDVTTAHGSDVLRTRTYVWNTLDSNSSNLVSSVEVSTDGLHTWQIVWREAGNDSTKAVTESLTTFNSSTGQRTVTVTAPDGTQTVSVYRYGLLQSVTRYDSTTPTRNQVQSTTYGYDKYDRQTIITDARNGITTLTLNDADLVTSSTSPDPGGGPQATATFYDKLGRATGTRNPDGTTITNFYSPAGLLTNTYGSRTYPVGYTYDAQGRMRTMTTWQTFSTGADAATTRWNYDAYRGWLKSKDYPDKTTGNPPITEGTGGPTYGYTAGGRLSTSTSLRGIVTTYTYGFSQAGTIHGDLVGVAYSNDPASTPTVSYTYDRLGRRSQIVQNSITTTLAYNDANQPLTETNANGLSVNWTYNNSLQRASLSLAGISGTYSVSYGYDAAGRLKAVNSGVNGAVYSYLDNSTLVGHIVFTNSSTTRLTTTKQYDRLNRLQTIASVTPGQSVAGFNYVYNNANQRTGATLADASYWLYTYDNLGQVISGKRLWQDGTPVAGQQYEYGFDDIGNRKSASMGGDANWGPLRQANYTRNLLNQYSQRDVPAAHDILGIANPTAAVTVNGDPAYRKGEYFDYALSTPNANAPWYNTVTVRSTYGAGQTNTGNLFVPQTPEHFTYDLDSNLTNDGRWAYIWDAENRLVSMTNNTSSGPKLGLKFEYDWRGRRIHKQVWSQGSAPTNDVKFVYDGWNLLAELDAADNAVVRSFLWGLDLSGSPQGAGGVGGLLEVSYTGAQTTNCFVAFDGNGNVAALADAASTNILAQYEYGPFGEGIRATGPMAKANPLRFSTKYQDDEADLLYYGYRYYSASMGRWLGRDPIGEHGFFTLVSASYDRQDGEMAWMLARARALNEPYLFARNDPVQRVDYLGLADQATGKCCDAFDATKDCFSICMDARKDANTFPKEVIGTVVCYHGKMCPCILGYGSLGVAAVSIGTCAGLDAIVLAHEREHEKNSECKKCGLYRATLKPGVTHDQEECTQRKATLEELKKYIADPITPRDSIECKKAAKAIRDKEQKWVDENCPK